MPQRPNRPLLDLLDSSPLAGKLLDNARKTVRHHVVDGILGDAVEQRVDTILGRGRRR